MMILGQWRDRNVYSVSLKEYEELVANGQLRPDFYYWISNLGTLVLKDKVAGRMDGNKIEPAGREVSLPFGQMLLDEEKRRKWTFPNLMDNYVRDFMVFSGGAKVPLKEGSGYLSADGGALPREGQVKVEMKNGEGTLGESEMKIPLENNIDLASMSVGIDKYLEEMAKKIWFNPTD